LLTFVSNYADEPLWLSTFTHKLPPEPCCLWEQAVAEASSAVWEQIVSILEAALFAHVDQPACDSFSPTLTKAFPPSPHANRKNRGDGTIRRKLKSDHFSNCL
jgi:hypothetical protein